MGASRVNVANPTEGATLILEGKTEIQTDFLTEGPPCILQNNGLLGLEFCLVIENFRKQMTSGGPIQVYKFLISVNIPNRVEEITGS